MGISVVMDILSPVTKQNKDSYLTVWLSYYWKDNIPPPSHYISALFNNPSWAGEFLVTEKISQTLHFSVLRSHLERYLMVFSPCSTYDYSNNLILTTTFSRPERTNVVDDFESKILGCLCLSLPRSSKSPELIQLL